MTQQIPDGSVVITPVQMYDEQRKTHEAVIDLTSTVKAMADSVRQERIDTARDIADHEARLRVVEQRKSVPPAALWTALGVAVAAIAALATVLAVVTR